MSHLVCKASFDQSLAQIRMINARNQLVEVYFVPASDKCASWLQGGYLGYDGHIDGIGPPPVSNNGNTCCGMILLVRHNHQCPYL